MRRITLSIGAAVLAIGLFGTGSQAEPAIAGEAASGQQHAAKQLYPIEVKGKFGFIDGNGEIVIKPVYDGLGYPAEPGGQVYVEDRAAGKQIYFDAGGERLFACALRRCGVMVDGLALYAQTDMTDDGAAVTRYGYINAQGKIVVPPKYVRAFAFSEGLARVNMGKASGYIDTEGELVIPYRFSETSDFSEGLAAVKLTTGGKYGFIDASGEIVIPPRFDHAGPFSDGAAVVSVGGKYGYIDRKGRFVLKPQFTMAQPFSEGLAFVERNGAAFYIDKEGKKVIQQVTAGGTFSEGLAPASRGRTYGYLDKSGTFVIPSQFEWADAFDGELAEVYITHAESPYYTRGYVNREGTIVWPTDQVEK